MDEYLRRFLDGPLGGVLWWPQLDDLWATVCERADEGWHLYTLGEPPPSEPAAGDAVRAFVAEVDAVLRERHAYDHCGIVYADDLEQPRYIKVYRPGNLGASCGSSGERILPGWTISLLPPVDVPAALAPPPAKVGWLSRLRLG